MAPSQSGMHDEIGFLIRRIGRLWRREADQALADHVLSQATALPLVVLLRWGKCARQGVLADEIGLEGPSVVRLIDLLAAEGLVERREDPTDRRAKMLHLTALGEAKAEEIKRVMRRVRADLMKGVSADELSVTFKVLRKIELSAIRSFETAEEADALS